MNHKVTALYVERRSIYKTLVADCWDEERNAVHYLGDNPVVAHPPCGPWGRLKGFCTKQDKRLAPIAVDQVRMCGGVLEHPANSSLWKHCNMPKPGHGEDEYGGWTIEVEQWCWGHRAIKRTWVYIVGTGRVPPIPTREDERPSVKGGMVQAKLSRKARKATPVSFALWLIAIAETCKVEE